MAKATRTSSSSAQGNTTPAPQKRSSSASKGTAQIDEASLLRELFMDELKDIYWAEKHLTKALPKMRKAATSPELASAFENHLVQTNEQIARLEQVFEMLDEKARAVKCEGMEGLVKEGEKVMEDTPKGTAVRDAGLIISGQKIEHYEISAYGSLAQLAKTLGLNEVADIFQTTLDEEKQTDQLLSELAISSININAASEDSED
ncbi:MAG TPA: ferritin-like domain-containing protein [Flavisolibacter sp.]|jgi:ferritin-like metal-binding protein YciE|nr:ferritin-like domain-containing protein [Flavisolibacter sp.]